MSVLGALTIKIAGDLSQFNKDIASVQSQLNKQTKGLQTVAKSMTSVGDTLTKSVTLPLIAAGAGLFKIGNDFDDAYDKIRVDTGKTGKEFEALQNNFREVAKDSASSFEEISTAVAGYNTMLGLTDKPLEDLSKQILNVSRITETDLNSNVKVSAQLFNNWKVSTKDQSKTLDLMFRASQQTGIGITDLMTKVTDSGQILRAMGYDIETATALVAGFDKAGIDSTSTIAAMKIGLKNMAKEGFTDPQEVLTMYIDKIKNAKTDIEATGIAAELFGARGGAQMAISIREGKLNLDDLIESLRTGTDSINGVAGATDDWKEKLTKLKNEALINLEPLANKVFDSVTRSVEKVSPKIEKLTEWFGNLSPTMQDNILKWGLILVAIGPVLSIAGRMTSTVIQLRNGILLLNKAMSSSALFGGIGLGPIAALVAGLVNAGISIKEITNTMKEWEKGAISWQQKWLELAYPLTNIMGLSDQLAEHMGWVSKAASEGTVNYEELTGKLTAYATAQHQGRDITVEQKVAMIDHENTLQGLMTQYDLTREEAEEMYASTQKGTPIIDDQTESLKDLLTQLYRLYNLSQDVTEATWNFEDAISSYNKVMSDKSATDRDQQKALFDVQDALESLQTKLLEGIESTDISAQKQYELQVAFTNSGVKAVELGIITKDEFIKMAEQTGVNTNLMNLSLQKLNGEVDATKGHFASLREFIDTMQKEITIKVNMDVPDFVGKRGLSDGGIVGFKEGGILNNILSAAKGVNLPKFDNGGMLAVLHPPEIVLNSKEAMQLVWNMANQPIKSGNSKNGIVMHNTFNSPKPLTETEISRQFNIFIRELGYRIGLG